jgi:ribosomal protein S12 methylthiotransferase accessory factor YcaO
MQLALERGWDVAVPVSEDSAYDVLIDRMRAGTFERVQVKRTWEKDGKPTVNLTRFDGARYAERDADWLAAVHVETGTVWLVPWNDVFMYTRKRITPDMAAFRMDQEEQ